MTLTLRELRAASTWAEQHVRTVHNGELPYADIALRHVSSGTGIGERTVVMCEACERISGKAGNAANYSDVTDYDAW